MHRSYLLLVTALIEAGAGLLLLAWPPVAFALLLGVEKASPEAAVLARVAGLALVALAVVCWPGANDRARPARQGLLLAVLIYDVGAAGILACAGWFSGLAGIALWPAVVLHTTLALWCLVCLSIGPPGESMGTPGGK